MVQQTTVLTAFLFLLAFTVRAGEPKPGNIAPLAKPSASSSRPEFPPSCVNDQRQDTQWVTAQDKETGQWLQLDWDQPRDICGAVINATGPWTKSVDVQVLRDGAWVSVGQSGSDEEKMPMPALIAFKTVRTKAVRFAIQGAAAYGEIEVYSDPAAMARVEDEYNSKAEIVVAGDLRGRLLGTVSLAKGTVPVRDAEVTVSGNTPNGPWRETAKTGKQGDFETPLPYAAFGPIHIAVANGKYRYRKDFDARDISTQLTPLSLDDRKTAVSSDGTWEIAVDPPKDFPANQQTLKWKPIKVPAHWEMEGFLAESGRAAYRKTFKAPADWKGKRVKLRPDAICSHAQVWCNGQRAGAHEGAFTPFELDITDTLKLDAENEILVLVDARSITSAIDNASFFTNFELAGIWQPICVFAVSPVHVSHLAVTTDFDPSYKDVELLVEFDLVNAQSTAGTAELDCRLFDPQGKEVPIPDIKSSVSLSAWQRKTLNLKTAVKSPQQWNAEQPRLYKLVAEITDSQNGKSVLEQPVGFREIEIKDRTLMVNGRPVKFRGICRFDSHPLLGRATTPEIDRKDMEMIKDANFNMVRQANAPPHKTSLDCADELGLYIENEGPTCWGRSGYESDLRLAAIYMGVMCEYVERDRNHPSIIDWSMCNESVFGRVFSMAHQKMKSIDPTRTYSCSRTSEADSDGALDLTTYHHPVSIQRVQSTLELPKPVFFDEVITVFHGYDDLAFFQDIDPGMRDYWIVGLPEIQRAINAGKNQVGTVQFAWTDDTFLVPGKGIGCWRRNQPPIRYTESIYKLPKRGLVGDVVWGTVDGWRRPRPEYWLSKKLYSPVQIEEKPLAIPKDGQPIVVPVENFNQFADLDQYVCRWELAGEKGEARAKAAPMSKGTLAIAVSRPLQPDDKLSLQFFDERARMVDAYRLGFKPHKTPVFPNSGRPARIVELVSNPAGGENSGYIDGSSAIRLLGPRVELTYDRTSGELYRALMDREVVMTLGPKLHIQKSTAPMNDYPKGTVGKIGRAVKPEDVAGDSVWHLTGSSYRMEGNQAVLDWKGRYGKDFDGGFEIRMDDAGDVEFRYEFTYKGPDIWAREIGLEFDLPLAMNRLAWDRKSEYNVYPDDHIGRPTGEAIPHPGVAQTVPPGDRPYGLDDHALGCNDFRSTKRNIYTASLTNDNSEGVQVVSDGTQHVRASVAMHDIQLRVLDYYGGTPWTYHEGFHYGPGRQIKTGEVLKGKVQLKLLAGKQAAVSP